MNSKRFAEILDALAAKESGLMNGSKKEQYAMDDERLWNFIQGGLIEGRRPSQIAFSYFTKHLVSIRKAVETEQYDLYWDREVEGGGRDECIVQRFADARNYLVLCLCCLEYEREMPISFDTLELRVPTSAEKALNELWTPSILKELGLTSDVFKHLVGPQDTPGGAACLPEESHVKKTVKFARSQYEKAPEEGN